MNTIIAGSRGTKQSITFHAIKHCKFAADITCVISGMCDDSPDIHGIEWAIENGLQWKQYYAAWDDLTHGKVIRKLNKYGQPYNAAAGFNRNEKMAQNAAALILVWDGKSPGSKDMLECARNHKLIICNCDYTAKSISYENLPP